MCCIMELLSAAQEKLEIVKNVPCVTGQQGPQPLSSSCNKFELCRKQRDLQIINCNILQREKEGGGETSRPELVSQKPPRFCQAGSRKSYYWQEQQHNHTWSLSLELGQPPPNKPLQ